VRVERLHDVPHDDAERASDVQLAPRAVAELRFRETVHDPDTHLLGCLSEAAACLLVEPARDDAPHLSVSRQIVVLPAVSDAARELLVDVRQNGDARLPVLRRRDVAERLQRPRFRL
jgi:hypothetical protein